MGMSARARRKAAHAAYNRTRHVTGTNIDPSRTGSLRRQFEAVLEGKFGKLRAKVHQLVVVEDAFGMKQTSHDPFNVRNSDEGMVDQHSSSGMPSRSVRQGRPNDMHASSGDSQLDSSLLVNTRWKFQSTDQQVVMFHRWLQQQIDDLVPNGNELETAYWQRYIQEGYAKGAGRAFDDTRKPYARGYAQRGQVSDFYKGTKYEFLQSSFAQPESIAKVKLLAGRTFTELKGVTDVMSQQMTRTLADGLVQGLNPRQIAVNLVDRVDKIGITRAKAVARTEIIRAHAEGALDAMEQLGVESVGVMVEWSTAGDTAVCPLCADLNGVVIEISKAHGMFPRHVNCRCTPIPSNVGEDKRGQKRSKGQIKRAVDKSLIDEFGGDLSLKEAKSETNWVGADLTVPTQRPVSVLDK